jgi:hypothetical protein
LLFSITVILCRVNVVRGKMEDTDGEVQGFELNASSFTSEFTVYESGRNIATARETEFVEGPQPETLSVTGVQLGREPVLDGPGFSDNVVDEKKESLFLSEPISAADPAEAPLREEGPARMSQSLPKDSTFVLEDRSSSTTVTLKNSCPFP